MPEPGPFKVRLML